MFEELNQHRQAVEEQIQKGFEIGFTGNELEKAHNVGDIHPNGKWVWTQLPSGRYDWRVIKKTAGNAATSAPQATANGKKSWDNLSDFYKNGSDERKMWMEWDRFEKTGDPNIISNIRKILEKKFPNVSSWKQYAPNTNNSSKLVAVGADGKEIASIDFGGKGVDLPKLQTFMDACDKVKKESSTSQQQTSEGKKTETSGSAVKKPASSSQKPSVKYGEMKLAAADKALVGKKITVNGKEAVIYDIGKWSSGNLFAKIVAGDDFVNNSSFVDLSDIDAGKMEIRGMKEGYFGKPGDEVTVELSDEEPKRETITKESLKEFLDYLTKNISKKGTEEFTNRVRKFLSIVPRKYRGSSSNYYNEAATAAKRLLAEFK